MWGAGELEPRLSIWINLNVFCVVVVSSSNINSKPEQPVVVRGRKGSYANDLWGKALQQQTTSRLRESLKEGLLPYMVPLQL